MTRLLLALFFPLAFLMALRCSLSHTDPWQDLRPFWDERPGEGSASFCTEHNGRKLTCHLLRRAGDWVQAQRRRFNCHPDSADAIDRHLLATLGRSGEPCTIWRSALRYDLEGTHHQAVQPTFISFANGDCLFYLSDWYNHVSRDAIPPPCSVMQREE